MRKGDKVVVVDAERKDASDRYPEFSEGDVLVISDVIGYRFVSIEGLPGHWRASRFKRAPDHLYEQWKEVMEMKKAASPSSQFHLAADSLKVHIRQIGRDVQVTATTQYNGESVRDVYILEDATEEKVREHWDEVCADALFWLIVEANYEGDSRQTEMPVRRTAPYLLNC